LSLKDSAAHFAPWNFRLDSATDVTTFPALNARLLGLPMPVNPSRIRHDPTGLEVRSGLLRFQIDGMDATEYVVSCFFLGNPIAAHNPAPLLCTTGGGYNSRARFDMERPAWFCHLLRNPLDNPSPWKLWPACPWPRPSTPCGPTSPPMTPSMN